MIGVLAWLFITVGFAMTVVGIILSCERWYY